MALLKKKRLRHPEEGRTPAAEFEEVYIETFIFLNVKLIYYFSCNNKA